MYDILEDPDFFACDHCGDYFEIVDMFESDMGSYYCPHCAVQLAAKAKPEPTPAPIWGPRFPFIHGRGSTAA